MPPPADEMPFWGSNELVELRAELDRQRVRLVAKESRIRELECAWAESREHRDPGARAASEGRTRAHETEITELRQRATELERSLTQARHRAAIAETMAGDLRKQLRTLERSHADLETAMAILKRERDQSRSDWAVAERRLRDLESSGAPESAPRGDDLRAVKGVGPAFEKALHGLGITRYEQLAALSEDDILDMARRLRTKPERIFRDGWVESARELAVEKQRRHA